MARILLFVVVAVLVWLAVRLVRGNGARTGSDASSALPRAPEVIEQCAWCGVHAPAGAALSLPDGRIYCSEAHREQGRLAANDSAGTGGGS